MPDRPGARAGAGDLAIVLHSHMPYVEGFGTYPFGEEWLFDAVIRSYLPVLEIANGITIGITPVLADQLESRSVMQRLRRFLVEHRVRAAEADIAQVDSPHRPAAEAEAKRYRHALELLDGRAGDLLAAARGAEASGRIALLASTATHAVMPLIATCAGMRLQLDAGLRSHRRRFGWTGGLWLPECAYREGLDALLAEQGVRFFCADQSAHEAPLDALAPVVTPAGPVAFPIDWEAISWLWSPRGYPSQAPYVDFHFRSLRGTRIFAIGGAPYDPAAAREAALGHATAFIRAVRERLGRFRAERGKRGLLVFAIDTELIGHWWSEGPIWLAEVLRLAPSAGVRLVTLPEALAAHQPEQRPLHAASWGDGKDLRTWDSPAVADLAWGSRRLELRLLRALGEGLSGDAARRAARELLAVQASDWAFLDSRGQAGDYPFQRATAHAEAMLEAIDSARSPDPRVRSLAPDLSLAPLLEP